MKPIALFFVVTASLIETVGFGWLAVEFWPDRILAGTVLVGLVVCLASTLFTSWVIDRRLRAFEAEAGAEQSARNRPPVVERI